MLDVDASGQISEEDFVKRNSAIYEGIEVHNVTTTIIPYDAERNVVQYQTAFDTVAGNISFENEAYFLKGEDGYKLAWSDSLIYPGLSSTDRVRVSAIQAKRGEILDRNDRILAGPGVASSVGIVPGKLENMDSAIEQIAELLEMKPEEIELMSMEPGEELIKEHERQQRLLEIPGVMISDAVDEREQLAVEQCLYAVMLASANDAAYALAEYAGGTYENFIRMMNDKICSGQFPALSIMKFPLRNTRKISSA